VNFNVGEFFMNVLYAKSVLYAYPCLDKICEQIDELVEKRLISSMYDFSPAEEQCIKIVNYGFQKQTLLELKQAVIRELKSYWWSAGDQPKKYDDHSLDELRYYLMTKPKNTPPTKPKTAIQIDKERKFRRIRNDRRKT